MSKIILLDSGPLGLAANPNVSVETIAFNRWLHTQLANHISVCIPDVADYEVRRELIRANKSRSLKSLDALQSRFDYLTITTAILRRAAQVWAQARNMGKPTANALSLDADSIIVAQALLMIDDGDEVVIATTNPKHLGLFVPAARWQDIN